MKIRILYLSVIFILYCSYCSSQVIAHINGVDSLNIKMLKGYFILYRRKIKHVDPDNTEPKEHYEMFYAKEISEGLLEDFMTLDTLHSNIYCIGDPWGGPVSIHDKNEMDSVYGLIEKRYTIADSKSYRLFDYGAIPAVALNSDSIYISIFQGQLASIGPFETVNSIVFQACDGYLYLKDDRNSLKYLYTVIFNTSNSYNSRWR
jgi:hypothetical protein